MGNSSSTNTEVTRNIPDTKRYDIEHNYSKLLLFERCIYMTMEKYNAKAYIPTNIYIDRGIASNINTIDDLDSYIINKIKTLALELGKNEGVPAKVPGPIYIMYAKKLEYDGTIFGKCFEDIKNNNINTPNCTTADNIEAYKFIASNIKNDDTELKKSSMSRYKFKNNYEYIIYYPSLSPNKKYFTNYNSYLNSNKWMRDLLKNYYLFNILDLNNQYTSLREKLLINFGPLYEDNIDKLIEALKLNNSSWKYPFIKEAYNTCISNGCVSDYGEDFDEIIPKKTSDTSQHENNAQQKAPYFPTKCLKQPNYKENMINDNDSFYNDIKTNINDCISGYRNNLEAIKKNNNVDLNSLQNTDVLLIKELKKCYFNYRHNNSSTDYNDDIKYHYSKNYNTNILTELSERYFGYPGVAEVTFPLFRLNSSMISNYILNLPWGDKLITGNYLITDDDKFSLEKNKKIYSFNEQYYMTLNNNGIIIVKDINNNILYTLNDNFNKNIVNVKFENGKLTMYITNDKNNIVQSWAMNVVDFYKGSSPFALILDNNGDINIYGDKFTEITNDVLKNRIKLSKNYIINYGYDENIETNMNNPPSISGDMKDGKFTGKSRKPIYSLDYDYCLRVLKDIKNLNNINEDICILK